MNPDALSRLQRLLGGPTLAPLRQRLRRIFEQRLPDEPPASVRLGRLAPHEAEALQALGGRAPRAAASVSLDLPLLDARLRAAGLADGLRHALELLDGPIATTAADRAAAAIAWQQVAAGVATAPLAALLAQPRGIGLLKRLAAGDAAVAQALCHGASRVMAALPAQGQPRAALAARCLGDAHALDDGRPVATLVLAALRTPADGGDDEGSRAQWALQGVSVNELARPALGLNLPGTPADGEPRWWSLRQLLRHPPAWPATGRPVFVCENPNLLAMAADALGPGCAPMVCTEGMPAAAQRALLGQLQLAGAHLHYHGDFDWPGIAIANRVLHDFAAAPWRLGAADYAAALARPGGAATAALSGDAVTPGWDAALGQAMQARGRAIAEEALLDTLLPDLRAAAH